MEKLRLYLTDIRALDEKACLELLGGQRRDKVLAMPNRQERLHSIAAGLLLKKVLGVSDEELVIGEHGKPEVKEGSVNFNISHGGNYAVLAVFSGPVGVDIEPIREDTPKVPNLVFTEKELEWLGAEPSPTRFAVLWTRLESALKADGGGFEGCERDYSVFAPEPWQIDTLMHDGHVISVAAGEEFEVCVKVVAAEELLKDALC